MARLLLPSLARLCIGADADPPKRRRGGPSGHGGLSSDSSWSVRLIALSRLLQSRSEPILEGAAAGALGQYVVARLKALALRGAQSSAEGSAALTESNVASLFALAGSHVASQHL